MWTPTRIATASAILVAALAVGLGVWLTQTARGQEVPPPPPPPGLGAEDKSSFLPDSLRAPKKKPATVRIVSEGAEEAAPVPRGEMPKSDSPNAAAPRDVPPPPPLPSRWRVAGPVGTWERSVGEAQVTLRVQDGHLTGTVVTDGKDDKTTYELHADYSTTRDSLLYGVITNVRITGGPAEEAAKKEMAVQKGLMDWPFSLRFRVDGDTLVIKDVRVAFPPDQKEINESAALLFGTYRRQAAP